MNDDFDDSRSELSEEACTLPVTKMFAFWVHPTLHLSMPLHNYYCIEWGGLAAGLVAQERGGLAAGLAAQKRDGLAAGLAAQERGGLAAGLAAQERGGLAVGLAECWDGKEREE